MLCFQSKNDTKDSIDSSHHFVDDLPDVGGLWPVADLERDLLDNGTGQLEVNANALCKKQTNNCN